MAPERPRARHGVHRLQVPGCVGDRGGGNLRSPFLPEILLSVLSLLNGPSENVEGLRMCCDSQGLGAFAPDYVSRSAAVAGACSLRSKPCDPTQTAHA